MQKKSKNTLLNQIFNPSELQHSVRQLRNALLCCLSLPFSLSACSYAETVHIQQHPINQIVQKNSLDISPNPLRLPVENPTQMNIMHIDIDYIYDADTAQQSQNLKALIKRIQTIQPNTIFLQAFADPDANGSADAVYFQNRHIPIRADLFHTVLEKIRSETEVQSVYAWLPLMAWELPKVQQAEYVQSLSAKKGYIRLSPFNPQNLQLTAEIFLDFMQRNAVDGILYHDDITLNDFEDSSPAAAAAYKTWGFQAAELLGHPKNPQQEKFSRYKTAYLDQYAAGISNILKQRYPQLKFARNMYAEAVLNPSSQAWFGQSNASTYQHYDYNAIMAMPYMEKAEDHHAFYLKLIQQAKKYDPDLSRTIFELQASDWNQQRQIPNDELQKTIEFLRSKGVQHIGYYPDDFIQGHPNANMLQRAFHPQH